MIDTKTLHDILVDEGIRFNMDDVDDARSAWLLAIMKNEQLFSECFMDFICEMDQGTIEMLAAEAVAVESRLEFITKLGSDQEFGLAGTYVNSVSLSKLYIADKIINNHRACVSKMVDQYAEDWMADCIGYNADMMEGAREDYEYSRRH